MLFSTGIFQSAEFKSIKDQLHHEQHLLNMALHLLNTKSWRTKCSSQDKESNLTELWLAYLNNAHSALALSDQHYVFVDSLRAKSRELKAVKKLTSVQEGIRDVVDASLKVSQVNLFVTSGAISMASN